MNRPYIDEPIGKYKWIRTFDPFVTDSEEYVWHRDHKDRIVTILEGEGWKFQFDEQIPQMINSSDRFEISKQIYHRLIAGNTKLKMIIEEIV